MKGKMNNKLSNIKEIFLSDSTTKVKLPLHLAKISAGFASPADDYIDKKLDLNEYLIHHPSATFFVRVEGDSMINAGINNNDLLIVDRALQAVSGKIIIAIVNNEFTVKRLLMQDEKFFLVPENPNYPILEIKEGMSFEVWGVVTNVIHSV